MMKPFELTTPLRWIAGKKNNPTLGICVPMKVVQLLKLKRGDWIAITIAKVQLK